MAEENQQAGDGQDNTNAQAAGGQENTNTTTPETGEEFDKERAMATIKKLREFEKSAKASLKELDALKAEKATAEKEQLEKQGEWKTLHEQAQAQLDQERQKATEAQQLAHQTLVKAALIRAAAGTFTDPADAITFADLAKLAVDEHGEVPGAADVVAALAKEKPYLLKTAQKPNVSTTTNPARRTGSDRTDADRKATYFGGQVHGSFWNGGGVEQPVED
jgi:hypothetical protein